MAAPVANIVGISYVDIASTRMADLQATMDTVLAAEANVLTPILRALFLIYLGRQFLLMMAGHVSLMKFWDTIIRSGSIIFLVTRNGAFVQWVRNPIFERIPQALSNLVAGNYAALVSGQPMAAQFDAIAAKGDAIAAQIDSVSTNIFSLTDWITSLSGHVDNGGFQFILGIIVGVWLLGQTLLGIVLCLFLPMLCFELFERTRGFVDRIIGTTVGVSAFGFGTSFILALEMQGMKTMFDTLRIVAPQNPAQAASMLGHVMTNAVLDLLTIAALPAAVGFGSGVVAGLAAPSAMMAMRSLSLTTGAVGVAASKAATSLSRVASSSARAANAIRRT